jgi:hypothetical protein
MQICKLQFCTEPCQAEDYGFRLECKKNLSGKAYHAGIYQDKGQCKYVNYSFVLNLVKLKITDLDWNAKKNLSGKAYRAGIYQGKGKCKYVN